MRINRAIVLLALGQTVIWAGLFYLFPALILIWEADLGWSRVDFTGALTLCIFLSAISSPVTGRLIDLGKGPVVIVVCAAAGAVSLFCLAWVEELAVFYLLWAIIGICLSGCLYDPCFALITRGLGHQAKRYIIRVTLIAGFAGTISFPCAHYLSEAAGWRVTVQVFSAAIVLFAIPVTWLGARAIENRHVPSAATSAIPIRYNLEYFTSPLFLCLGIGFSLIAMVHGVALPHLLPILQDRNVDPGIAVLAASMIGPMQVVGRLAMMYVQRFLSNHLIGVCCFLLMAGSILALIWTAAWTGWVAVFVLLYGSSYGLICIVRPVITRDILGEERFGTKHGVLTMLYLYGAAAAPFLGALAWRIGGYTLVLTGLIMLMLAGLVLYLAAYRMSSGYNSS